MDTTCRMEIELGDLAELDPDDPTGMVFFAVPGPLEGATLMTATMTAREWVQLGRPLEVEVRVSAVVPAGAGR